MNQLEKGHKSVTARRAADFARKPGYHEAQFVQLAVQDQPLPQGLKYRVQLDAA